MNAWPLGSVGPTRMMGGDTAISLTALESPPVLTNLVEGGAFGEGAEELEEFCTDVLLGLQSDADWLAVADERVVVGVTFGSDPRDFLRTATRANRYGVVRKLWAEHWRGEELSSKIHA